MPFTEEDGIRVCFVFQAEDGIRDYDVTGVQTCALPIFVPSLEPQKWKFDAIFSKSFLLWPEKHGLVSKND